MATDFRNGALVPRVVREADVVWEGNVARGQGAITAASSGAFAALPFSVATRVGATEGRTSPEELLAAAHAGCFGMSLASELTTAGTPPERLDVHCRIVLDEVEEVGHRIVASELEARGRVPGAPRTVSRPQSRQPTQAAVSLPCCARARR